MSLLDIKTRNSPATLASERAAMAAWTVEDRLAFSIWLTSVARELAEIGSGFDAGDHGSESDGLRIREAAAAEVVRLAQSAPAKLTPMSEELVNNVLKDRQWALGDWGWHEFFKNVARI